MRYLGNKTRLVPFILDAVESLGIEGSVACDPFAGTASVATALKREGWAVHAGDLLASSYALQVSRVALDRTPAFPGELFHEDAGQSVSYGRVLGRLAALEGRHGFLTEHFTPAGDEGAEHGRMYFTPENARRLDAAREKIAGWHRAGHLDEPRRQLLLATLIEAADRVANTTGVYASFVKSWQPNARKPLELRPIRPTAPADANGRRSRGACTAFQGPAETLLRRVAAVDLLYLDPPYNGRQYPGYYHIPELLADGWHPPPPLRGKTGLIPDEDRRSDWCRRSEAADALERLLDAADARHILFSYNDEGILETERIESALRDRGGADSYRRFERPYRRYRSDSDGPERSYARDRVREQLHYVRCR